ncbi:MAG: right-handed parallel beta-helix repeat-containing protein [Chitinivibrionales bacterium]|nr:right-handed parallel beta-helix repeat-containing protein [Chitinivibrionales bacterium]
MGTISHPSTVFPVLSIIFCLCSWPLHAKKTIVPLDQPTIQKAFDNSEEGDTVYVLNGTYKEVLTMPDKIFFSGQDADKVILYGNGKDPVVRVSNYSTIRNFTIMRGGTGILSENTNAIIQNNCIKENRKTGIQCLLSLPLIQNNFIAHNEWSGVFCELIAYGSQSAIEHNVIADNGYSGIMLSRKSGVLVQNNVLIRNRQFGIFVSKDSRKSRIIYNNFYQNRQEYNEFAIIDETNVSIDPKYESLEKTSFQFLATFKSPLVTMGKNGTPIGIVGEKVLTRLFKDSDDDGIADDEDKCPDMAEDKDGFEDDDGCPDYDNDKDGISDGKDGCPDQAEDFDGFKDQDGCPDTDNDEDGILDTLDGCPNQPESVNGFKDDDGCPDEKP